MSSKAFQLLEQFINKHTPKFTSRNLRSPGSNGEGIVVIDRDVKHEANHSNLSSAEHVPN